MMLKRYALLVLWLLSLLSSDLMAQVKRVVTANSTLVAPYSPFIDDYYEIGSSKYILTLLFNDYNEPSWDVKLKLRIESGNIVLETKANFFPSKAITLTPGIPVQIKGDEWTEYFNLNNLVISGISPDVIARNGVFPEGPYQFSIEVLDYHTGTVLSNKAISLAYIKLGGVPQKIEPKSNYQAPRNPQNLMFQWQMSSPVTSPETTEYQLKIYEITSKDVSPENALANGNAVNVFESDWSTQSLFNYTASQPQLEAGKTYAYTIQVHDADGKNIFKNNGLSQQYWFSYGYPTGGVVEPMSPTKDYSFKKKEQKLFKWKAPNNKAEQSQKIIYQLKIVELPNAGTNAEDAIKNNSAFYEETTNETSSPNGWETVLEDDIKPDQWYAWQVRAMSGEQEVASSPVSKFNGPPSIESFFAADMEIPIVSIEKNDLNDLSGVCRITVDKENNKSVDAKFEHLKMSKVGEIMVLKEGEIETSDIKIDPIEIKNETEGGIPALFTPTGLKINTVRIMLKGRISTPCTFAVEGDAAAKYTSQETWLTFNKSVLNGILNFEEGKNRFNLLDPKGFTFDFAKESYYLISNNKYSIFYSGKIFVPETIKDLQEQRVGFQFKDRKKIDYLEIDATADKVVFPSFKPFPKINLIATPGVVYVDLSASKSPAKIERKEWTGVYMQQYSLEYRTDFDPSRQLILKTEAKRSVMLSTATDNKLWIDPQGIQFYRKDMFADVDVTFNKFPASISEFNVLIENSTYKSGIAKGSIKIPIIDTKRKFYFSVPMSDDGFMAGYLDEKLDNQSFSFNSGGEERVCVIKIKRAVFAENERLEMAISIDIPALKCKIDNIDNFIAYGDLYIGAGQRNGTTALSQQVQAEYRGFKMTVDSVGFAFLKGSYILLTSNYVPLGEEVSGAGGPPRFRFYSTSGLGDDYADLVQREMYNNTWKPNIEIPINVTAPTSQDKEEAKSVQIKQMYVEFECAVAKVKGNLTLKQGDPRFGNVFEGHLDGEFYCPSKIIGGVNIIEGVKDNVKFWYFDAFYADKDEVGVNLGPMNMVALEGRIYRHMSSTGKAEAETKKPQLQVDPSMDFGFAIYMQLIDATYKGKFTMLDLGVEAKVKSGEFDLRFKGEGTFLNTTGRVSGAGGIAQQKLAEAAAKEVVNKVASSINDLKFTIGDVTLSPYIKEDFSEGGMKLAFSGQELSLFGNTNNMTAGMGYKNGSDFVKIGASTASGQAEFGFGGTSFKMAGSQNGGTLGFSSGSTGVEGSINVPRKSADLSIKSTDFAIKLGGDGTTRRGSFDLKVKSDFHLFIDADVESKKLGFGVDIGSNKLTFEPAPDFKSGTIQFMMNGQGLGLGYNKTTKTGVFNFSMGADVYAIEAGPNKGKLTLQNSTFAFDAGFDKPAKKGNIKLEVANTQFGLDVDMAQKSGSLMLGSGNRKIALGASQTAGSGYLNIQNGDNQKFSININTVEKSGNIDLVLDDLSLGAGAAADSAYFSFGLNSNKYRAMASKSGRGEIVMQTGNDIFAMGGDKSGKGYFKLQTGGNMFYISADKTSGSGDMDLKLGSDQVKISLDKPNQRGQLVTKFGDFSLNTSFDATKGEGGLSLNASGTRIEMAGGKSGYGSFLYSDASRLINIAADKNKGTGTLRLRLGGDSIVTNIDKTQKTAGLDASFGGFYMGAGLQSNGNGRVALRSPDRIIELSGDGKNTGNILYDDKTNLFQLVYNRTEGNGLLRTKLGSDSIRTTLDRKTGEAGITSSFGGNYFSAGVNKLGTGNLAIKAGNNNITAWGNKTGAGGFRFDEGSNVFNFATDPSNGYGNFRVKVGRDSVRLIVDTKAKKASLGATISGVYLGSAYDPDGTGRLDLNVSDFNLSVAGGTGGYGSLYLKKGDALFDIKANKKLGIGVLRIKLGSDSISGSIDKTQQTASFSTAFGGNRFGATLGSDRTGKLLYSNAQNTIELSGNPQGSGNLSVKTGSQLIRLTGDKSKGGSFRYSTGLDSIRAILDRTGGTAELGFGGGGNSLLAQLDKSGKGSLSLSTGGKKISLGGDKLQGIGYLTLMDGSSSIKVFANKQTGGRFSIKNGGDSLSANVDKANNSYSLNTVYSGNIIGATYDKTGTYLNLKSGDINVALGGSKSTGVNLKALKGTQGVKLYANRQNQGAITIYTGSDSIKAATNKAWQVAGAATAAAVGGLTYLTFGDDIKAGIDDDGKLNLNMKKGDNRLSLSGYQSGKGNLGMQLGDKAIYAMANPQDKAGTLRLKSGNDSLRVAYDSKLGRGDVALATGGTALSAAYDKTGKGSVSLETSGKSIRLMVDKSGIGSLNLKDPNNIFELYANQPAGIGTFKLGFGSDSLRTSIDKTQGTALMNAYIQGNLFAAKFNQNGTGSLQLNTKEQEILLSGGSIGAQQLRFKKGDNLFGVEADKAAGTGLFRIRVGSDSIRVQGNTTEGTANLSSAFSGIQLGAGLDKTGVGSLRLYLSDSRLDVSGGNGMGLLNLQKGNDLFNIRANRSNGTGTLRIKLGSDSISGSIDKTQQTASFSTAFGGNRFGATLGSDRTGRLLFENAQNTIELSGNPQGSGNLLVKTGSQLIRLTGDKSKGGSFRYSTGSDSIRAILDRTGGTAELGFGGGGNSLLAQLDKSGKGSLSLLTGGKKISLGGDKSQGIGYLTLMDGSNSIKVFANKQTGGRFSIKNGSDSLSANVDKANSSYSLSTVYSGNIIGATYDKTGTYLNLKSGDVNVALGGSKSTGVNLKALKGTQGVKLYANRQNQGAITIYTGSDSIKAATNKAWQVAGAATAAAAVGGLTYLTFGDDIKAGIDDDGKLNLNMKKGDRKLSLSGYQSGKGNAYILINDNKLRFSVDPSKTSGNITFAKGNDSIYAALDKSTGLKDVALKYDDKLAGFSIDNSGIGKLIVKQGDKQLNIWADKTGKGSISLAMDNQLYALTIDKSSKNGTFRQKSGNDSVIVKADLAAKSGLININKSGTNVEASLINASQLGLKFSDNSISANSSIIAQGENTFSMKLSDFNLNASANFVSKASALNIVSGNNNLKVNLSGAGDNQLLFSDNSMTVSGLHKSDGSWAFSAGNEISGIKTGFSATNLFDVQVSGSLFAGKLNVNKADNSGNISIESGKNKILVASSSNKKSLNIQADNNTFDYQTSTDNETLAISKAEYNIQLESASSGKTVTLKQGNNKLTVQPDKTIAAEVNGRSYKVLARENANDPLVVFADNERFEVPLDASGFARKVFNPEITAEGSKVTFKIDDSYKASFDKSKNEVEIYAAVADKTATLVVSADGGKLSYGDYVFDLNTAKGLSVKLGGGRSLLISSDSSTFAYDNYKMMYGGTARWSAQMSENKAWQNNTGFYLVSGGKSLAFDLENRQLKASLSNSRTLTLSADSANMTFDAYKLSASANKFSYADADRNMQITNQGASVSTDKYALVLAEGALKATMGQNSLNVSQTGFDAKWDKYAAKVADGSYSFTDGERRFSLDQGLSYVDNAHQISVESNGDITVQNSNKQYIKVSSETFEGVYDDASASLTSDKVLSLNYGKDAALSMSPKSISVTLNENSLQASAADTSLVFKMGEGKQISLKKSTVAATWDDYKVNLGGASLLYFTDGQRIVDLSKSDLELNDGDKRVSVGADASLQIVNGTTGYLKASQKGLSSKWDNYKFVVNNDSLLYFADGQRLVDLSKSDLELRDGSHMVAIGANGSIKLQDGDNHTLSASQSALRARWDDYKTTISSDTALYFTNGTLKIDLSKQEQIIQSGDDLVAFNLKDTSLRIAMGLGKEVKASPSGANLAWGNIKATFGSSRNLSFTDGERTFAFEGQKLELSSGSNKVAFDAAAKTINLSAGDARKIAANAQGIDISWDNIKTTFDKTKGASFTNGTQSFNLGSDKFALTSGAYSIGVDVKAQTLEFANGTAQKISASASSLDINWDNIKAGYAAGKNITYTDGTRSFDLSKGLTLKDGDNLVAVTESNELIINAGSTRNLYASEKRLSAKSDDYEARYTADSAVYIAAADNKLSIGGGKLNLNIGDNSLAVGKDTTIQLKLGAGKELSVSPKSVAATWDDYKINLGGASLLYFTDGQRIVDLGKSDLELSDGDKRVSIGSDASMQIVNGTTGYLKASQKGFSSKWDNYKFVVNNDSLLYFTDGQRLVDLSKSDLELRDGSRMVAISANGTIKLQDGDTHTLSASQLALRARWDDYKTTISSDTALYFTNGTLKIDLSKQEQTIQSGDNLVAFNLKDSSLRIAMGSGKEVKASPSGANLAWDNIKATFGSSRNLSFTDGERTFAFEGQKLELANGDSKVGFNLADTSLMLAFGQRTLNASPRKSSLVWDNVAVSLVSGQQLSFFDGTRKLLLQKGKLEVFDGDRSVAYNAADTSLKINVSADKFVSANPRFVNLAWSDVKAGMGGGQPLYLTDGSRRFELGAKQMELTDGDKKVGFNITDTSAYYSDASNNVKASPSGVSVKIASIEARITSARTIYFSDGSRSFDLTGTHLELAQGSKKLYWDAKNEIGIIDGSNKFIATPDALQAKYDNYSFGLSKDKGLSMSDGTRSFGISGDKISLIIDANYSMFYYIPESKAELKIGSGNSLSASAGMLAVQVSDIKIQLGGVINNAENYLTYTDGSSNRAVFTQNDVIIKQGDVKLAIEDLQTTNKKFTVAYKDKSFDYTDERGFKLNVGADYFAMGGTYYLDTKIQGVLVQASDEGGLYVDAQGKAQVTVLSQVDFAKVVVDNYKVGVSRDLAVYYDDNSNYLRLQQNYGLRADIIGFKMAVNAGDTAIYYNDPYKNMLLYRADLATGNPKQFSLLAGPAEVNIKARDDGMIMDAAYGSNKVIVGAIPNFYATYKNGSEAHTIYREGFVILYKQGEYTPGSGAAEMPKSTVEMDGPQYIGKVTEGQTALLKAILEGSFSSKTGIIYIRGAANANTLVCLENAEFEAKFGSSDWFIRVGKRPKDQWLQIKPLCAISGVKGFFYLDASKLEMGFGAGWGNDVGADIGPVSVHAGWYCTITAYLMIQWDPRFAAEGEFSLDAGAYIRACLDLSPLPDICGSISVGIGGKLSLKISDRVTVSGSAYASVNICDIIDERVSFSVSATL